MITRRIEAICRGCGQAFSYPRSQGKILSCSRECQKAWHARQNEGPLTHETLTKLLNYERETGVFTWKEDGGNGKRKSGQRAGYPVKKGYRCITIRGFEVFEHRLAWFHVHGAWPKDQIDHRDSNKSNNAMGNLREATNAQNQWNTPVRKGTLTGLKGVTINVGRFVPQIHIKGKQVALGRFDTAEEAKAAYDAAALNLHGAFARLS